MSGSRQQLEFSQLEEISQLEEMPQLVGSRQQLEISQLEISQLEEISQLGEIPQIVGNPQLLQIPQHGRAQRHQIQQHFLPANASTRVAAPSTTVGANVSTSQRTSTGGCSPPSSTSLQGTCRASAAMHGLPSKNVASA